MSDIGARRVIDALRSDPRATFGRSIEDSSRIVADGCLRLDGGGLVAPFAALCTVTVHHEVATRIPRLVCHEPWLVQGGAEWHLFRDGSMCLDLPARWADHVGRVLEVFGPDRAAKYAAEYFFHSAQWLLNHHRFAHSERLTSWPDGWPEWAHDGSGLREYHRSRHAA